jgi:hypothetical protein
VAELNKELNRLKNEIFKLRLGLVPKSQRNTKPSPKTRSQVYQSYIVELNGLINSKSINREFTSAQINEFYDHAMNDYEWAKIDNLGMDEMMARIQTPTKKVKYIEGVGYTIIERYYRISPNLVDRKRHVLELFVSRDALKSAIQDKFEKKIAEEKEDVVRYTNGKDKM